MFFSPQLDSKDQLENVQKMRIYRYEYKDDYAQDAGIPPDRRQDAGVLAQELLDVLPDAVQSTGDVRLASGNTLENFLVVNKVSSFRTLFNQKESFFILFTLKSRTSADNKQILFIDDCYPLFAVV